MKKYKLVTASILLALISACSTTPNNAPVVERGVDGRTQNPSNMAASETGLAAKPVDARNIYIVKKGDTLFRIALDHGQSYSDIVTWNNLKNPNDIKVDQVLRIAPPDGSASVQTGAVVSSPGAEVRPLSSLNPSANKTGPRGDKRPYSEAALAEMQKSDAPNATVVAPVVASVSKPEIATPPKPVDLAPAPAETESVDWMWPADGKVIAGYDEAKNKGLDISGKLGQDVLAAGAGKVMYAGSGIRGYGNLVIIKHTNTLLSAYAHNKAILVKEGQAINKGQKIAEMGNSDSDAVKLHFEIRQQGKPVDPSKFLPRQ
ncbi:peptidoglycan DD-metalloendopeptidase family protein [Undibacterium sp. Jales W-56]|uniref:peptidoglycan DD-metalloendopeptidase family protein n=1 Tax=Undibacterium sp. Jales W-56 TaxID=2897325 RepID=UPI0021CEC809|nr:peptidoglycan DD-metalloendopeptidase family protein [Undibacterium sp. Jales W-56]MCU6433159.1 peptidoglycan DD-metalloendopeptidase family protein [Undibacterium sp. Jales W-56]